MDTERDLVLNLVQRHGWNATAFQTLEPGFAYRFYGSGCVAYVDTGSAWVVAGAPIAPTEDLREVAGHFVADARAAGKRSCFFAVEDRFLEAVQGAYRSFNIGEQPVYSPLDWANVVRENRSLRSQLRRAAAKGVRVRELSAHELESGDTRAAIEDLARRWLATRGMAPMTFLVRLELFGFSSHRRCFVAEREGRLLGFALLVPVPARSGWLLEDLVRAPHAPNGTSELLVDAALSWAGVRGCEWFTLGLSPLAGQVPELLRFLRRGASFLYDFEGLHAYKAKLRPRAWSKIFLAYPPTQGPLASVVDVLRAFSNGNLLAFGVRSILRGPEALLRALALLLLPWTVVLALAPAEHWFGSALLKWGWVAFDLALALTLLRVLKKPTLRGYQILAATVSADAVLTTLQAALWNLPRAAGLGETAVVIVACAAPILVSAMLWGATLNRVTDLLCEPRSTAGR